MRKILPSGYTKKECHEIIEQIAESKARQYGSISYLDQEDLKQEVRIKCWNVLPSYDSKHTKANLASFLGVCADNRLRDIKRSIHYKHNQPCPRCPFFISPTGCVRFDDKMECGLYSRHEKYVQTKLSVSSPIDIETQIVYDNRAGDVVKSVEFIDFISTHLPSGMMPIFEELASVNFDFKKISIRKRDMIKEHLWFIYTEFGEK